MPSCSATTTTATCSMPAALATGSRPHRAISYLNAFGRWRRRNARSPIFRKPKAGVGAKGSHCRENKRLRVLKAVLVGQFEFVEWTPDGHLRHSRFMGLREGKAPKEANRDT